MYFSGNYMIMAYYMKSKKYLTLQANKRMPYTFCGYAIFSNVGNNSNNCPDNCLSVMCFCQSIKIFIGNKSINEFVDTKRLLL